MDNKQTFRDDSHLIRRCISGDHQAFRDMVERYEETAFRFAFRLACNTHEAQDICQEAFIKVWGYRLKIRPEARFSTLLYTIISRLWIDHIRRDKKHGSQTEIESSSELIAEEGPSVEAQFINQDMAMRIKRLSQGLPPRQRLVFTLRDLEDLTIREVVEVTGLSTGSVKTNLSIARQKIRVHLTAHTGTNR